MIDATSATATPSSSAAAAAAAHATSANLAMHVLACATSQSYVRALLEGCLDGAQVAGFLPFSARFIGAHEGGGRTQKYVTAYVLGCMVQVSPRGLLPSRPWSKAFLQ
jgi:hypothetical protein